MTTEANPKSFQTTPLATFVEISVTDVKAALTDGQELAFFDLREEVDYAKGHILYAAHLPLSRIELQARTLIPRLATRIVLTDGGEGLAEEAARILGEAGYADVRLLTGRNGAWAEAGFALYTGRNVPSIGFFEVVEHELGTPNISAVELKQRLDRGDDIVVLDTRPKEEFEAFHIPGATNTPGVEIVHRLGALDLRPDTLLVANCAGRTRSILGAQTLINAGVHNPVASLTGGTMEWLIAGYQLEQGPGTTASLPLPETLAERRALVQALADKVGVQRIDQATLAGLEADGDRTLFRFDVRTPEEYAAGHLPGFRSAPGGQLSSGTERFAGTRGARIVLHDPDGIRDLLTASWLVQLGGYEVFVVTAEPGAEREVGPEPRRAITPRAAPAPLVAPDALQRLIAEGQARVFDIAGANQFRKGHIPGAVHTARPDLFEAIVATDGVVVITSEDGLIAGIAAPPIRERLGRDVRVLLGGTQAWRTAGLPLDKGGLADEAGGDIPDRYALPPARRNALFRDYLDWEVGLVAKLTADPDAQAKFRIHSVVRGNL